MTHQGKRHKMRENSGNNRSDPIATAQLRSQKENTLKPVSFFVFFEKKRGKKELLKEKRPELKLGRNEVLSAYLCECRSWRCVRGKIECSVQKLMHLKGVAAVAQIQILCDFNCRSYACDRDDSMRPACGAVLLCAFRSRSYGFRFGFGVIYDAICRAEMKYSQNTHNSPKHTKKKNLHINKRAEKKAKQNLIHGEPKSKNPTRNPKSTDKRPKSGKRKQNPFWAWGQSEIYAWVDKKLYRFWEPSSWDELVRYLVLLGTARGYQARAGHSTWTWSLAQIRLDCTTYSHYSVRERNSYAPDKQFRHCPSTYLIVSAACRR